MYSYLQRISVIVVNDLPFLNVGACVTDQHIVVIYGHMGIADTIVGQ